MTNNPYRDTKGRFCNGPLTADQSGRRQAQEMFSLEQCERCEKPGYERHHKDGNPLNNVRENIEVLCRRCHMVVDGRLDKSSDVLRSIMRKGESNSQSIYTESQVREIRRKYIPRVHTCKMLAEEYGGTERAIQAIVQRQNWRWLDE